jgi:outer membrane lipoprotein carrier protein
VGIRALAVWVWIGSLLPGQDLALLLAKTEKRYNSMKTLQVSFREVYFPPGRPRIVESGMLYLRKPGRMRWAYEQPVGKLFVADGKFAYLYRPSANQVERLSLRESEDYRAPLAFLLGRVDFRRDFDRYEVDTRDEARWIRMVPKNSKLPYRSVRMVLSGEGQIRRMSIEGTDGGRLEFEFGAETVNPALKPGLFEFEAPAGAEVLDEARGEP